MRRRLTPIALGALLSSEPALAVKPGETLYIKTKGTKVLEKPDPKSKQVTLLEPPEPVKWLGPDEKNRQFHAVEAGEKKGFVLQANLSPSKPADEYPSKDNGAPVDAKAFASSGAATKALSGGALKTASGNPSQEELARALISVEATAKSVDPKDATSFVLKRTQGGGGK